MPTKTCNLRTTSRVVRIELSPPARGDWRRYSKALPSSQPGSRDYAAEELVAELGPRNLALTATFAMQATSPRGLTCFPRHLPQRFFEVPRSYLSAL